MASLTIFTPTYNRKGTLKECYRSLCAQDDPDFLWMIIDDGSTDGTEEEVRSWIIENQISIEYHFQKNAGKPAATNHALDLLNTDLWLCLDSDDVLTANAVSTIKSDYLIAKQNPNCCGIIYNRYKKDGASILTVNGKSSRLPEIIQFATHIEIEYIYHANGDKAYVYFAKKLHGFRFPIIEGERFIGESFQHIALASAEKFYISHERVYLWEYRDDGLSANNRQLHKNNPKGYKLLKKQLMLSNLPLCAKLRAAIMYVAACKLCGDKRIIRESPRPILTFFAFFPGLFAFHKFYGIPEKKKPTK